MFETVKKKNHVSTVLVHGEQRLTMNVVFCSHPILYYSTSQNEREETTQNTTVTKSAACAPQCGEILEM